MFCENCCIWRCILDASMESDVLHIQLLLCHLSRPNKPKSQKLEKRNFIAGPCKMTDGSYFKSPKPSKVFSKTLSKARWRRGMASCCQFLGVGILCSYKCPHRSGHDSPVNLQEDKCYSLFCNFLISTWMKTCYTFKDSFDNGLPYISQATGNTQLVAKIIW